MKIITSERARADLEEIFEYISRDSLQNAVAVVNRIVLAIDSLSLSANRARRGHKPGTRELVVDRTGCMVVYRIGRNQVLILRVWRLARGTPRLG